MYLCALYQIAVTDYYTRDGGIIVFFPHYGSTTGYQMTLD